MSAKVPDLERMSAPALREFARREGIRITYITERKKRDLIRLIREALAERA